MKAKKDTKGVQPKDFIMLYGGCHTAIRPEKGCYPALLYIAGGKDKLVKASTCLKRRNDTGVKNIEVMVIDGAYHMFDSDKTAVFKHPKWGKWKSGQIKRRRTKPMTRQPVCLKRYSSFLSSFNKVMECHLYKLRIRP